MSQLSQLFVIPDHLKNGFERKRSCLNVRRLLPIAIIFYVIEWVIFYFQDLFFNVGPIILSLQLISTFLIPLIAFVYYRIERFSNYFINFVLSLYVISLIVFSIILALKIQTQTDLMHMHIMILTGLIAILYFKPWESFLLIFGSGLIMILLLPYFQSNPEVILINQVNLFIYNIILWMFSLNLYLQNINTFSLEHSLTIKNQELEFLVQTDSMTRLYNHKAILDFLSEEMSRSDRNEQALCILILDIDDFKKINDQFGHQVGDEVLITLSNIIKQSLRTIDRVGRYGGEEFLILLSNTHMNAARLYALRLQSLIREYKLPDGEALTLSGGLTEYKGETIDALIKEADQLLYRAKNSGKNQIISR